MHHLTKHLHPKLWTSHLCLTNTASFSALNSHGHADCLQYLRLYKDGVAYTTIRAASASREKAKENCGGKQTDISKVWIDEDDVGLGLMVFVLFNVFNKGGRK